MTLTTAPESQPEADMAPARRDLKSRAGAIVAGITVLAVLGGGAMAAAAPRDGSARRPAATASDSGPSDRAAGRKGGIAALDRAVHGDLIVRTKSGFENVTFDRGLLSAKDGSTITLRRPDGVNVTVSLTDTTRFRGVAGADQLQTGKPVGVLSKDGKAIVVAQRPTTA